jgi:DnaA-homolog protein
VSLYLLDDCDRLPPASQIDAFGLFNQIRERGAFMVSSGALAPAVLPVREDLRTRMGWGLIYQVHGLTDAEKIAALTTAAATRGLILSPGVLPYLLSHFRRDMRSLSTMLDALDHYSLETQRAVTLPLLRELLQAEAKA